MGIVGGVFGGLGEVFVVVGGFGLIVVVSVVFIFLLVGKNVLVF